MTRTHFEQTGQWFQVYDNSRDAVALTPTDILLLRAIETLVCDASLDVRTYIN